MSVDENIIARSPEDALVGTLFADSYEILAVLGKGGMSVVYKARYCPIDQLVAVKVMQAHLTENPATLQRLKHEAKLAGTLDHPNIVRVLRLHIAEDGFPFLVADLVDGRTLQAEVDAQGPFTEDKFMHIFGQVLDALEHAHGRNIVHRDVKPSNLMICQSDNSQLVKVVDFGISKMLSDSAAVTQGITGSSANNIFGSPGYMSPEQCTGARIDARTDIYSLGCVMYEALTGVRAFQGETALDTMYHQVHDMPLPFSQVAPERHISPHLEAAIFAALQKDRADRPQNIAELRAMLSGKTVVRRNQQLGRIMRRSSQLLAPLGAIAIGASIMVFFGSMHVLEQTPGTTGGDEGKSAAADTAPIGTRALFCYEAANRLANVETRSPVEKAPEVLSMYRKANDALKDPRDTSSRQLKFRIKLHLGSALDSAGQYAQARTVLEESLKLSDAAPLNEQSALYSVLSNNALKQEQTQAALDYALQGLATSEAAFKNSPLLPEMREQEQRNLCDSYAQVSLIHEQLGSYKQAERACRQSWQHAQQQSHELPKLTAVRRLSAALLNLNRALDARELMQSHYLEIEKDGQEDPALFEECALGHELYAKILDLCGSAQAAQQQFAQAIALSHKVNPRDQRLMQLFLSERLLSLALHFYRYNDIARGDQVVREQADLLRTAGATVRLAEHARTTQDARAEALQRLASRQK